MSSARTCLLTVLLALPLAPLVLSRTEGAAPPTPSGPTPVQIARWVKELGADDFAVRETATKQLRAAGQAAEPALLAAAAAGDLEVVRRARDILKDFKWGIYPETPQATVNLIREYQSAARGEKLAILKKLAAAGRPGGWALTKIATAEDDVLARREVFPQVALEMPRLLPALLAADNFAALDGLAEVAVASEDKLGFGHYAAYCLLRGRLDERIRHWEAVGRSRPPGKPEAEVVAYLQRARGDLAAARRAAEKAERLDLVEAFLVEAANWRELARRPDLIGSPNRIEKLGYRASYNRLTGNDKELAAVLAEARKLAKDGASRQPDGLLPLAKVFFLNGRPVEAIALLVGGEHEPLRFEAMMARTDIKAAFALVEKARKEKAPDLPALELLQARALYGLGETDKALAILKRYGERIEPGVEDASWFEDLVAAEARIGRREQALGHCGRVLAVSKDKGWPQRLIPKVFADKKDEAETLWEELRRQAPAEPGDKAFGRLQALLDGKASGKEVAALMRDMDKQVSPRLWIAIAAAALACKQEAQAITCLESAASPEANLRLGDLFAKKGAWPRAADRYERAFEQARKRTDTERIEAEASPELALYLTGHALVKAGKMALGKRKMEDAHWLPLGDGHARYEFARALAQRGHAEAARREGYMLRRVGEPNLNERSSFYTGEGQAALAQEEVRRKHFLKAADALEQATLRTLRPYVNFVNRGSYVGVPGVIHRVRARGLLAAGKVDEALREAALAQMAVPGNIDLAVRLVPELEKRGHKKEAATLFAEQLALQENVCREYPNCSWAHNAAAWLAVTCRRDLDKALVHARKAVELAPNRAGYQDTLAEAFFQLGRSKEAVAAQKRAVALEPGRAYFRQQLRRIEAGNPRAARPDDEEE